MAPGMISLPSANSKTDLTIWVSAQARGHSPRVFACSHHVLAREGTWQHGQRLPRAGRHLVLTNSPRHSCGVQRLTSNLHDLLQYLCCTDYFTQLTLSEGHSATLQTSQKPWEIHFLSYIISSAASCLHDLHQHFLLKQWAEKSFWADLRPSLLLIFIGELVSWLRGSSAFQLHALNFIFPF